MSRTKSVMSVIAGLSFGVATWFVAGVAIEGTSSTTVPFDRISAQIQKRAKPYVFRDGVGHRLDGVVVREGRDGTVETELRSVSNADGVTRIADVTISSRASWRANELFLSGSKIAASAPGFIEGRPASADLEAKEVDRLANLALRSFDEAAGREPLTYVEANSIVGSSVDAVGVVVDYRMYGTFAKFCMWAMAALLGYLAVIHVFVMRTMIRGTWSIFYLVGATLSSG